MVCIYYATRFFFEFKKLATRPNATTVSKLGGAGGDGEHQLDRSRKQHAGVKRKFRKRIYQLGGYRTELLPSGAATGGPLAKNASETASEVCIYFATRFFYEFK